MRLSDIYNTDDSYVELSFHFPTEARELEDPLFRFDATYYIEKRMSSTNSEDSWYENVPVFKMIGHTSDFYKNYLHTADAIAESTIENYAFANGLYKQLVDTEFHEQIFANTGQWITRWATLETVFLMDEMEKYSEDFQAKVFEQFLIKLKPTWRQLFHNDVTLISFNEHLYVSPEKKAQKTVNEAYKKAEFFETLNKQALIEGNSYDTHELDVTLKEVFEQDSSNNLFSEDIKNPKIKHYFGFIYSK